MPASTFAATSLSSAVSRPSPFPCLTAPAQPTYSPAGAAARRHWQARLVTPLPARTGSIQDVAIFGAVAAVGVSARYAVASTSGVYVFECVGESADGSWTSTANLTGAPALGTSGPGRPERP